MAVEDPQTPLRAAPLDTAVPSVPTAAVVGKHAAAEQSVHAAADQPAPSASAQTASNTDRDEGSADTTQPQEPVNAPGRATIPVEGRAGADATCGKNAFISWGARSDVGLVRSHNEDSFLIRTPCFAVCE